MSAEAKPEFKAGRKRPGAGRDAFRSLSFWLASPGGRAALASQKRLWTLLTEGSSRQRVLLIESPVEAWCAFIKEQGFFLTVSPRPAADYELPFSDNEFDLATVAGGLEYVKNPVPLLLEAARVSRRGVVIIVRNGSWPARLRMMAENNRSRAKWPPLENWFTAGGLERLIKGLFKLRNFRLISGGPDYFLKGRWFDDWLGCYFSPAYTVIAASLPLADQPQARAANILNPAAAPDTGREQRGRPPSGRRFN